MRILVTGGAGYVGSVLIRRMASEGHDVTVLDNYRRSCHSPYEGVREVPGDIRTVTWADIVRPGDSVVHLAAIVGDPACSRHPQEALEVNQDASLRMIDALSEIRAAHLVFASTCSNYGTRADVAAAVDESAELAPISLYARTKVAVENRLLKGDLPFAVDVLRLSTLFGTSPSMRFDLTVNEFTRDLALERPLEVFAPRSWRPYVHTADAASAILSCLAFARDSPRVLNVGCNENNSTKMGIVHTIEDVLGRPGVVSVDEYSADGRDYRVDFARIRQEFDSVPTITIRQGVTEIARAILTAEYDDPFSARYVVS